MAFGPAFDASNDPTYDGVVATFIVPATACDLACPVCVIRQRREAVNPVLTADDYSEFLDAAQALLPLTRVCLQGYEPLLPESWACSQALLAMARSNGVSTSLITNGTHLGSRIADLEALSIGKVTVSLDSPDQATNDRRRGRGGAFQQTVAGIRLAAASAALAPALTVASILYPGDASQLVRMPELLRSLGVRRWSLSPLLRIGRRSARGGFVESIEQVLSAARMLAKEAALLDVDFFIDDEFRQLGDLNALVNLGISSRAIGRAERLLRLDAQGGLSVGHELLSESQFGRAHWLPSVESANTLLRRAVPELLAATHVEATL